MKKPLLFVLRFKKRQKKWREPSLTILLTIQIVTMFLVAAASDTAGVNFRWMVDLCVLLTALVSVFIVAAGTTTRMKMRMVKLLISAAILSLSGCAAASSPQAQQEPEKAPTYSANGSYDDNGAEPPPNNGNQNFGFRGH